MSSAVSNETILDEIRKLRDYIERRLSGVEPITKPLPITAAAKALGVSASFLRKAEADGRVKSVRMSGKITIAPEEIERLKRDGIPKAA